MGKLYPKSVGNIDFSDEQFLEKALSRVEADAGTIMDLISENPKQLYNKTDMQKLIIFLHVYINIYIISTANERYIDNTP